jgi:hypothetical protein
LGRGASGVQRLFKVLLIDWEYQRCFKSEMKPTEWDGGARGGNGERTEVDLAILNTFKSSRVVSATVRGVSASPEGGERGEAPACVVLFFCSLAFLLSLTFNTETKATTRTKDESTLPEHTRRINDENKKRKTKKNWEVSVPLLSPLLLYSTIKSLFPAYATPPKDVERSLETV